MCRYAVKIKLVIFKNCQFLHRFLARPLFLLMHEAQDLTDNRHLQSVTESTEWV